LIVDGYTRISVDLQEENQENTSIENQKRIIKDYVAENFPDAKLKLYEDRDRSGYTFSQREHYQEMRKELMSGDVKILIVKDFSRFSRRNSLGLLELETLRDAGVRIISIGDNIDYPTKDDWMLIQFKFLMNEMPVTDTSKKIKHIIANRQKNGEWICAVPYGYRLINTKEMLYEIDPPAAEVVREVFRLYNNGWGYKKIANHLTESGVPTPRANEIAHKEAEGKTTKLKSKNEWSIISVSSIIQNDFYIGTLRQKKYTRKGINGKDVRIDDDEQIVIENAHDPIIDMKTFAYAKEQLNLRSKSNYRGEKKYATDYSGFLFCGDCGSPMFSMSRPDLAAAYTCGTYHRRGLKGCTSHHIRVDLLDELLKGYILRVRDNCERMITELEQAIKEQPQREAELGLTVDSIEQQITDAKDQLKELYKQKVLASLGKSDAKAKIREQVYEEMETELTERIAGLEKQFAEVSDMRNTMIQTNRKAKTVIDVFEDVLRKEKLDKRDIGLIVDRITVYEDHLNVKLKTDVDTLLSLEDKEETVNFPKGSKDIEKDVIVQSSTNRRDKVFTVNVISSGDPLEIYTDNDGEVIFKKYSPIGELSDFAGQFADVMARSCELPVLICDRDHCVAAAGISKKEVLERRISSHLEEIMESRRSVAVHKGDIGKVPPLEGMDIRLVVAIPIIAAGDVAGAVTLVTDGEAVANDTDFKMCQIAAAFLGKQMEE
jgi:stage V sporulation protein T